jgi:hypothetical protein
MKRKRSFFARITRGRTVARVPQSENVDARDELGQTERVVWDASVPEMSDETERVDACPFSSSALVAFDATARVEERAPHSDATERVVLYAADEAATGKIVIRKVHADATRRVAPASLARLYARAVVQEIEQAEKLENEKDETRAQTSVKDVIGQSETRAKAGDGHHERVPEAQRLSAKPVHTRRKFLALLHLIADVLLVLMLLSVSLALYQQHIHAQQALNMSQVQRLSEQYKSNLVRQEAAQQLVQAKQQAQVLVQQFYQEVTGWGNAHLYTDPFDRRQYALDSGYMQPGVGGLIDHDLSEARTLNDYARVIGETTYALFNLHMLEADYADRTPYNQPHASDLKMLAEYHLQTKTVLMVSLTEQVMRVYEQAKLTRAFYVTTGRYERPSLPGVWPSLNRLAPTLFISGDPPGSLYWFPPTKINYAILYHLGGFFVHDAPWRGSFGPGTQFPHQDAYGNTAYNFDGSHGCINLSESDAGWVYHHTDFTTIMVIY